MEQEEKRQQEEVAQNDATTETVAPETEQQETEKETSKKNKKNSSPANEMEEKIQEMGEKLAEMNDKYTRVYSEYENYRKRTNLEKADLLINGSKETIKAILPIVDDMERALQAMKEDDHSKEGIQLIYNKMMNILGGKGLKPMESKGEKFDENLHEAVAQIPAPSEELKNMVVDVVEKGYYLNDKVLRYAKVVVGL